MARRLRQVRESDGGFTLIELLLVIIILGVLAAVVVFSVAGISDRGNASACKATRANVSAAAESFFAKHGAYPANTAAMETPTDRLLVLNDLSAVPATGGPANAVTESIKGPNNGWELQISYFTDLRTSPQFALINC
jgi:prepilin-type N-terminal cleavage/methylation domain-containing protein